MKNGFNIPEVDFTRPSSVDFDDIREMSREMAEIGDIEDVSDQTTTIDQQRWDEFSNRMAVAYAERLRAFDHLLYWKS
jgi:hypothetical protein